MQIKDVMTTEVDLVDPETTLAEAARLMRDDGIGSLPVGEDGRLVGMVTDRDIVVRGIADHADPALATVGEVMSPGVFYCFDDETVGEVAVNMGLQQIRRLPVVNRENRLVGVVSLGDLAARGSNGAAGQALEGIAQP